MNRKKQKIYILVRWDEAPDVFTDNTNLLVRILKVYATKRAAENKLFKLNNRLGSFDNYSFSILEKSVQGSDVIGTRKNNKDEVQTVKIVDSLKELSYF